MKKRPAVFLGIIQLIIAIGAIPAGLAMVIEPDGVTLGMTTDILSDSPFENFFIPGLVLLIVIGMANAIGAFLAIRRDKYSGVFGVGLGFGLIGWTIIQIYFIGLVHFLQPLFLFIGVLEAVLGFVLISRRKTKG